LIFENGSGNFSWCKVSKTGWPELEFQQENGPSRAKKSTGQPSGQKIQACAYV